MRFNGEWLQCEDGVARPVVRAKILSGDGVWRAVELLVDTGADLTLISASVLRVLHLQHSTPGQQLGGLGGRVESVTVTTQIQLTRDDGHGVQFRGTYAACTDSHDLDMSVLGRDILDMFAVILDRRADVVAILGGNHYYTVQRA